MPTDKHLFDSWKAGYVLNSNDDYCDDYSREPSTERNYPGEDNDNSESSGTVLGVTRCINGEVRTFLYRHKGEK
jgi:hypothetical protein